MKVELLREKAGILPPGSARLAWVAPEVLCRQEAFDSALAMAEHLRSSGVSEAALSGTAAKCPQLFTMQVSALPERRMSDILLFASGLQGRTAAL